VTKNEETYFRRGTSLVSGKGRVVPLRWRNNTAKVTQEDSHARNSLKGDSREDGGLYQNAEISLLKTERKKRKGMARILGRDSYF